MNNKKILNQSTPKLLSKSNVVLVGIGKKYTGGKDTGTVAIIVGVTEKKPLSLLAANDIVPATIKGLPTDVYEVGVIRLLGESYDRTGKFRPAPGGVSIGHKSGPTGTKGCMVQKRGVSYILSNNHVLADVNKAAIGSEILQPGYVDGGRVATDTIAWLSEFVRIEMGGPSDCPVAQAIVAGFNRLAKLFRRKTRLPYPVVGVENTVDCAIALPVHPDIVVDAILEDDRNYVWIKGEADPEVGMPVKKSGRTTGTTRGRISLTGVTVRVYLGDEKTAIFRDQFAVEGSFSQGGDSGSVILSEDNRVVGLLFAGSSNVTMANRWSNVKSSLRLD